MNDEVVTPSELDSLKERADQLGITYHPSIGVDKLREKVNASLNPKTPEESPEPTKDEGDTGKHETPGPAPVVQEDQAPVEQAESAAQFRLRKKKEASELVRIQVTNMNPNKRDYDGEIFSAGNTIVGTFKKYVPFDTEWHVPRIILNMIKQRQCQVFVNRKDPRGGTVKEGKLIREYNVTELEPLTGAELKELAQRQAMAAGNAA